MRRSKAALIALSTGSVLLVGTLPALPSASARPQATVVTIQEARPTAGEPFALEGQLRRDRLGEAIQGAEVIVEKRVPGRRKWKRAGTDFTSRSGGFSVDMTAATNVEVRARFRGGAGFAPDVSPVVTIAPRQSLSVESVSRIVSADAPIALSGVASPALAGKQILLQQRVSKEWVTLARTLVARDSTFDVSGEPAQGGFDQPVRVRAPRTTKTAATFTPVESITVYEWYPLTRLSPESGASTSINFSIRSEAKFAGISVGRSWAALVQAEGFSGFDDGRGRFTLNSTCTDLRGTAGVPSDSGVNARWTMTVELDGVTIQIGTFGVGESSDFEIDVAAVNELDLVGTRQVTPPDSSAQFGDAVWGAAEIQCAGVPGS